MRGRAARIGQIHVHHLPVAAVQQPLERVQRPAPDPVSVGLGSQVGTSTNAVAVFATRSRKDGMYSGWYGPTYLLGNQHLPHSSPPAHAGLRGLRQFPSSLPPSSVPLEPRLPGFPGTTGLSTTLPAQAGACGF